MISQFRNVLKLTLILCTIQLLGLEKGVLGKSFEEDLTLTSGEKDSLEKFKVLVLADVPLPHEYMKKDLYLIRWLRARNYNLIEAKKMLIDNLKWRKEKKMDQIHTEDWSYFDKTFRYSLKGRSRDGKPVLFIDIGSTDIRKEVVSGKMKELMRYADKALDEACNLVRDLGVKYQNVSQGILIIDTQGFNLAQHGCLRCVSGVLSIVITYELHYPGCADSIFIVNSPSVLEPIIQSVRGLFHPETNRIFHSFGTNRNIWQKVINQTIDLSELPPELGGTKFYKDYDFQNY